MNPAFIILTFFIFFLIWENMKTSTFSPDSNVAKSVSVLYGDYADEYGKFWGIPPERLLAHICVETQGRTGLIGGDGEVGIMQMLPTTLAYVNGQTELSYTANDIALNAWASIETGAAYLALLKRQTGTLDKASQEYNGNPSNPATSVYLSKVLAYDQLILRVNNGAGQ
jgi:soluble lytic murein transglycosylase-like protein